MTETPIPVEFDPETLATAGVAYDVPGHADDRPPAPRPGDRGMLNYAASSGPRNELPLLPAGARRSAKPEVIAPARSREPAYMHSFGLTERWLVLAEFPFVVNPLRLAFSGRPYIENYRWKPELGTRFTLLDRAHGRGPAGRSRPTPGSASTTSTPTRTATTWSSTSALFEDAGSSRTSTWSGCGPASRWPSRSCGASASPRAPAAVSQRAALRRPLELPRINYGRCNERPYRYAWGVGWGERAGSTAIVKVDVVERARPTVWCRAGCYAGEPVFVAEPGAEAEDDGRAAVGRARRRARAARSCSCSTRTTLDEVARAEAPHHIPFGFHGQFAPV